MKNKRLFIFVTVSLFCFVVFFFIAGFKKSPSSKGEHSQPTTAVAPESSSSAQNAEINTVEQLSPTILKEGKSVFAQFSVSELNQQFARKKEILNASSLLPTVTNHPVLDALIEQKFAQPLSKLPDTFSKAKYCYDWLLENTQFGGGAVNMQNMYAFLGDYNYGGTDGTVVYDAYRILLTGQGVCDNYASALTVLYRYIGLEAYIVHGKAILADGNFANHVWVAVNIKNAIYWFDPQVETAAADKADCTYAMFCALPNEIPFYTNYNIADSRNAYQGFRVQSPLQVLCAVNAVPVKAFVYKPGDVNEYGDVVKQSAVQSAAPDGEFPLMVSVSGGAPPYHCTVTAEYLQNGNRVTNMILPTTSISDAVTFSCTPPTGAQLHGITVRIRDDADRNMVCILVCP